MNDIKKLIDTYYSWLRDKTKLNEFGDFVEITTPFLDRNNDYLQLYVKKTENNYLITDDGYTISDLFISGCKIDTPKRKALLETTLNGFGVKLDGNNIYTTTSIETFALKKHCIIQAILAINDLFFTSQPIVANLFVEDVAKWLESNKVRFIPNLNFTGKTGYNYSFHFAIPKSDKQPERIIQAINYPSRSSVENYIMSWLDTKESRQSNSNAYAFLNDGEIEIKPIIYEALSSYNIKSVPWKKRNSVIEELVA